MSTIRYGWLVAGLLAVSLPGTVATSTGAGAAPLSGAANNSVDRSTNLPTDFSSARVGGGGGGGARSFSAGRSFNTGRTINTGRSFNRSSNVNRTLNVNRNLNRNVTRNLNRNVNRNLNRNVNRNLNRNVTRNVTRNVNRNVNLNKNINLNKTTNVNRNTNINRNTNVNRNVTRRVATIGNKRFSAFSTRRFWWKGGWHTLIGITLLTGFVIGPDFYYPEDYVALAEPVCTGYTDDGCALRWQEVAADDGEIIPTCVEFCPRVRKAAVAPAPVAAVPRGGCEVEVFQAQNLTGASFKTTEDQPLLNDQWNKHIASINVVAGTWDFATEPQYGGDAMRLQPGTYRDLGPNWDAQISSFMCTQ